jgi:hypothetical protein
MPVLLAWLPRIGNEDVKESIVRHLKTKAAKGHATAALLSELTVSRNPGYKWVVGDTLSYVATKTQYADLLPATPTCRRSSTAPPRSAPCTATRWRPACVGGGTVGAGPDPVGGGAPGTTTFDVVVPATTGSGPSAESGGAAHQARRRFLPRIPAQYGPSGSPGPQPVPPERTELDHRQSLAGAAVPVDRAGRGARFGRVCTLWLVACLP